MTILSPSREIEYVQWKYPDQNTNRSAKNKNRSWRKYAFGGGIFFRRAHWLVKAQCSINLRRAGQRDKHRWAVTCREIIEWIFIQWCHLFFSGNERMYFYAVTQSHTLTLMDMDFLWNWTHCRFFGIVLCLFNAEYKGSRQRKTRIFYGQADRKGGSAHSALTVSNFDKSMYQLRKVHLSILINPCNNLWKFI